MKRNFLTLALGLCALGMAACGTLGTSAPYTPIPYPTFTIAAPVVPPASASPCHIRGALPDAACTPGATNSDVRQDNIDQTICRGGWTRTVRPPVDYTQPLKVAQIAAYGYADANPADYEEDHLIPLELGGSPTNSANLWPQPRYGSANATSKDRVENYLKAQVCNGALTLSYAQQQIASDWTQFLNSALMGNLNVSPLDPDDNGD